MAGNQTDAKNRAKRELEAQEKALKDMRRRGASSSELNAQQRRVDSAATAHAAAAAAESAALSKCAPSWF